MKKLLTIIITLLFIFSFTGCSKSNYDLAVDQGFQGSVEDYLNSLKGNDGASITINDLYNAAVLEGYKGTFLDFIDEYLENTVSLNTIMNYNLRTSVIVQSNFGSTLGGTFASAGSGVFIDLNKTTGDAYIITNYHVVFDKNYGISKDISIYIYGKVANDYTIKTTYIGGSMTNDIAVLKVEGSNLLKDSVCEKVTIGNSEDIYAGDSIFAIGNPSGSGFSINEGILSVQTEYIDILASDEVTALSLRVMRIDAAVNKGNSGGGLFDSKGRLVGIVNAKAIEVENISYAIPVNVAYPLALKIIDAYNNTNKVGSIYKPFLGMTSKVCAFDVYYDEESQKLKTVQTIKVVEVAIDSVCNGLLKEDDIIESITVDGITYHIDSHHDIPDLLLTLNRHCVITVGILRNYERISVDITLSNVIEIK